MQVSGLSCIMVIEMCTALQVYYQKCYKLPTVAFLVPRAVAVILHSSCGLLSCFSLHYVLASSFCTWAGISSYTTSVLFHQEKGKTSLIFLMIITKQKPITVDRFWPIATENSTVGLLQFELAYFNFLVISCPKP